MNNLKSRICNASCILGVISALLIFVALFLPAIDFSQFSEEIKLEYNLFKVCENVRLISPIWTGIPVGIIIGAVLMLVLSFIKIPLLKLIPNFVVIAMVIIMLVDMGNIVSWAQDIVEMAKLDNQVIVNSTKVYESFRAGIYMLAIGVVTGIVSCFMRMPE